MVVRNDNGWPPLWCAQNAPPAFFCLFAPRHKLPSDSRPLTFVIIVVVIIIEDEVVVEVEVGDLSFQ